MVRLKVDLNLLPMKAQFFLWNAGTAPVVPFLPTYARQLGFSSFIVGTIYMVLPITGMLAKPLLGAVADRYQCQKILFIVFQIITAVSFFIIQFIPDIPSEAPLSLHCNRGEMFLSTCGNKTTDKCAGERLKAEVGLQEVLHCQLTCKNPDLREEFCKSWNKTEYCDPGSKEVPVAFGADIPLNYTIIDKSCTHLKLNNTKFPNGEQVPPCLHHISSQCFVDCQNLAIRELTREAVGDAEVPYLYQFWAFFVLLILSWVGMAVVVSVGDAICFGMLGDKPSRYGHQRLWGAVGWGLFSLVAGFLVDEFSRGQSKKNYTSVFYLMLVMLILDMFVSSRLKYTQTKMSASIVRDVGKVVMEPRVVVFLIWTITVGLCTGLLWQFLFWHLEDLALEQGCDMQYWIKTLEGLVMGIQCFGGEVPFFFLSGLILQKIGHVNAMTLVLFGVAVRFILYSVLTNPWWCLPVEFFQGITFGIFYATMASYASIVAPPGTEATVQGLVGALFEGVGVSLGSLLGGVFYGTYGGQATFLIYGIGALAMFVVHALVQYLLSRKYPYNVEIKGFDTAAHYASPHEAIQILQDEQSATS